MTRTIACPICGEPYKVFDFYAYDQSACPDCRDKAEKKLRRHKPTDAPPSSKGRA